jgi:hypothetical protein
VLLICSEVSMRSFGRVPVCKTKKIKVRDIKVDEND